MGSIIWIHRIYYLVDGYLVQIWGFSGGSAIKNLLVNAGEMDSIPGSGRSLGGGKWQPYSSILAWEIPWTEESGRLQYIGLQKVRYNLGTKQ